MRKCVLLLTAAIVLTGCGSGISAPPATDDPGAMFKHWLSLMNAHDIEKAADYLLDNAYDPETESPLSQERKATYASLMKVMMGGDEMSEASYTLYNIRMEGEDILVVTYYIDRPEAGKMEINDRMIRRNGRWWFRAE